MTIKYVSVKTSRLYESATSNSVNTVLIYGEKVDTLGSQQNGRIQVRFRGVTGWIDVDHLTADPSLEIYFIDVGQGDSTFIVTPERKKILVDGGVNTRAFRFLAWKYRLYESFSPVTIDLLVMTHADEDHIGGLIPIISHPKIKIKKIIHSGLAVFKEGQFNERLGELKTQNGGKYLFTNHDTLDELEDSALSDVFLDWKNAIVDEGGIDYHAVDSTSGHIDIGDPNVILEVVGPRVDRSQDNKIYPWFKDHAHTINGHSVVLRLTYNKVKLLLSGDLNPEGSKNLLQDPDLKTRMDAHILKAPHHGSHEFEIDFLDSVNPQISVISSGNEPDHGHPRANFIAAIGNVSRTRKKDESLVFSTEISSSFVEVGKTLEEEIDLSSDELKLLDDSTLKKASGLYKRRLHGMINVRTDGNNIYAGRRISSGYLWESYGPITPSPRSI